MRPILFGQPILTISDEGSFLQGIEVLFRLRSDATGLLCPPVDFLSFLKTSTAHAYMDAIVMSLLVNTKLPNCGGRIFINVFPDTLSKPDLTDAWIDGLLELTRRYPNRIVVEFSERFVNASLVRRVAETVRVAGAMVALDDYTGLDQSSRNLLDAHDWDYVKICSHSTTRSNIDIDHLIGDVRISKPGSHLIFERLEIPQISGISRRIPEASFQSFCLATPQPLSNSFEKYHVAFRPSHQGAIQHA